MTIVAVWNGTRDEWFELLTSIEHNCSNAGCPHDKHGACGHERCVPEMGHRCAAHRMLEEQKTLHHLIYGKRLVDKFKAEEWRIPRRRKTA